MAAFAASLISMCIVSAPGEWVHSLFTPFGAVAGPPLPSLLMTGVYAEVP